MYRVVVAFLCAIFLASAALASDDGQHGFCEVWGQIVAPNAFEEGMKVELVGKLAPRQRVPVLHGNFELHSVPAGIYQFRVFDRSGHNVFQSMRPLTGSRDRVTLVFPITTFNTPSSRNKISLRELSHRISRKARDAFRAATKAIDAGESDKGITFLEKALEIDPEFSEAEVSLATQYVWIGRDEEGLAHFQAAFERSPAAALTGYDFAIMLLLSRKYEQAEAVARQVLRDEEELTGMHGVLALSLIRQRRHLEEANGHLELAATEFPVVRLLAANAFAATGRFKEAEAQAREYLQTSAHECERPALEKWVKGLTE